MAKETKRMDRSAKSLPPRIRAVDVERSPQGSPPSAAEITKLINSPDFVQFISTIEESLDDDMTYNEMLSDERVLQEALNILRLLDKQRK